MTMVSLWRRKPVFSPELNYSMWWQVISRLCTSVPAWQSAVPALLINKDVRTVLLLVEIPLPSTYHKTFIGLPFVVIFIVLAMSCYLTAGQNNSRS